MESRPSRRQRNPSPLPGTMKPVADQAAWKDGSPYLQDHEHSLSQLGCNTAPSGCLTQDSDRIVSMKRDNDNAADGSDAAHSESIRWRPWPCESCRGGTTPLDFIVGSFSSSPQIPDIGRQRVTSETNPWSKSIPRGGGESSTLAASRSSGSVIRRRCGYTNRLVRTPASIGRRRWRPRSRIHMGLPSPDVKIASYE